MPTGISEIVNVTQEVIDSIVQRELKRKAILLPTISDYTRLLKTGANGVKLPRAGTFSVQDKVENTAGSFSKLTPEVDLIPLDKYKAVFTQIEDDVRKESTVNMEALYLRKMASAMGRQMDDDIYAELANVADGTGTDEDGNALPDHRIDTNGGAITREFILEARRLLDETEADEDRTLLINPATEKELLNISDFIDASKYGSSMPIQNGLIGTIYGIKVVKSNLVPDAEWCMYTKEHVGFIRNISMKFESQRAELRYLADDMALSTKYGVATLQLGRLGVRGFDVV